ncbi:hypothetical protein C8F04DRAFT_1249507 [Mycena alexandri]|uniref:Uncharacterized protein n=1 Tax=Mycena alexandri TaxID=1745969 RepID=A0AAD6TH07_9AGAR|nr:hypothetical protein C8F04DRAFT_1249507 [Mycena alexandri]
MIWPRTLAFFVASASNGSMSVPAMVPSQQYLDLYAAHVIGDPLYGTSNTEQSWARR